MDLKLTSKLLIGFVLIASVACKKDSPEKPTNPLNGKTTAIFNPEKIYGSVADIEGNKYKTIVIGNQTWMAENLRTTKYRNGDEIPNVKENAEWNDLSTSAYCNYNNTESLDTIATLGRLYNWYAAADTRNIAPKGWRVPTIADWTELFEYLGGVEIASNKLKEVGDIHWEDPYESDNSSGFTALPTGSRDFNKNYVDVGFYSIFWTHSEYNSDKAGCLNLFYFSSNVYTGVNYKYYGYAIRCIKE